MKEQGAQLFLRDPMECWAQRLEHELLFPPNYPWQGIPVDVEPRHPYFDRRLVEFGLEVPPELKFTFGADKKSHYACRKTLQRVGLVGILPDEFISLDVKTTYGQPVVKRICDYGSLVFRPDQS